MPLPRFEYLAPKTLPEACALLSQHKEKAKVVAGGTDLLVQMKGRKLTPQYIIGLKNIGGLDYIKYDKAEGLKIGALATISSIAGSTEIWEKLPILGCAAEMMATPQVRNMGTIGGNLCNAAPSADLASPLISAGAKAKLVSPQGERTIALEDFFTGPGETALQSGEILAEIQVPNQPPNTGGAYLKETRTSVDLALVGVAASITLDSKDKTCRDAKITLGAVAPTPIRAKKAEGAIKGKEIKDISIEEAAQLASEEARPISDVRSSAYYRTELVKVLTKRAIRQASEQAKSA